MLSRQEGSMMHHQVQVHSTKLVLPVETQDGFFCCLVGLVASTGIAIVH